VASLNLQGVQKSFGAHAVIRGVDLDIRDGEFCVFVGPSGCGKSTLLRLIAGLENTTSGRIEIAGRDVTTLLPSERGISMVFQSYALYPHMTVAENIGFGLKLAGKPKDEILRRTEAAARMLHLSELLDRRPVQLSGGQRQRVAIGRAIVREPDVFLFDEPLSNLDAALRVQMRIELSKLHADLKATMIYVTHDQIEAMTMADKIVVLNAGQIEQVGSPLELYHRPRNVFVATFIGSPKMNLFETDVDAVDATTLRASLPGGGSVELQHRGMTPPAVGVRLGIRPEHLTIAKTTGHAGKWSAPGTVVLSEHLGDLTLVYVDLGGREPAVIKADGLTTYAMGQAVSVEFNPAAVHLFGPDGLALLNGSLLKEPVAA